MKTVPLKSLVSLIATSLLASAALAGPEIVPIEGGSVLRYRDQDLEIPADLGPLRRGMEGMMLSTATKGERGPYNRVIPPGRCAVATSEEPVGENSRVRVGLDQLTFMHFDDPAQPAWGCTPDVQTPDIVLPVGGRIPGVRIPGGCTSQTAPYHNPDRRFLLFSIVITNNGNRQSIPIRLAATRPVKFMPFRNQIHGTEATWHVFFDDQRRIETPSVRVQPGTLKIEICDFEEGLHSELISLDVEILQERP